MLCVMLVDSMSWKLAALMMTTKSDKTKETALSNQPMAMCTRDQAACVVSMQRLSPLRAAPHRLPLLPASIMAFWNFLMDFNALLGI